jgi:iron complex transport system substrate-binding protein
MPWRFVPLLGSLAAALVACLAATAQAQSAPNRVVSMNLCTDQLAMLIASDDQLHSVSYLALDPEASALAAKAKRFVINHGLAEEIFTMSPDLVLAGTFTNRASVGMLRRLGFRVEQFAPCTSLSAIKEEMTRMGDLLGRRQRADDLVRGFDRALAAVPPALGDRPLAALYYANSYTSGTRTLADEVVERAGLRNLGAELGLSGTVRLPLETLVMSEPDLVIGGEQFGSAPALAYQTFAHPALKAVLKGRDMTPLPDRHLVCGGPFTIEAIRLLAASARKLPERAKP